MNRKMDNFLWMEQFIYKITDNNGLYIKVKKLDISKKNTNEITKLFSLFNVFECYWITKKADKSPISVLLVRV